MTYTIKEPRFSKAELKVQAIARRRANNQLMRVPWPRFWKAYEEYPHWHALTLWVQAIMATHDAIPSWLATDLRERCPGFIEHKGTSRDSKVIGLHLLEWVHNQKFGYARGQGWLDALAFYGVRHPQSLSAWAYWEQCEEEWNRRLRSSHTNFEEWLHSAIHYNPQGETSVADLADAVDRYLDCKVFSCWLEPLTRARIDLPKHIASELERRCPGFLELSSSHSIRGCRKNVRAKRLLMAWIEDHFFAEAKKEGWLDTIRQQVRVHPRYARIVQYSKRWNKSRSSKPTLEYPSFAQWCRTAENYTDE